MMMMMKIKPAHLFLLVGPPACVQEASESLWGTFFLCGANEYEEENGQGGGRGFTSWEGTNKGPSSGFEILSMLD